MLQMWLLLVILITIIVRVSVPILVIIVYEPMPWRDELLPKPVIPLPTLTIVRAEITLPTEGYPAATMRANPVTVMMDVCYDLSVFAPIIGMCLAIVKVGYCKGRYRPEEHMPR